MIQQKPTQKPVSRFRWIRRFSVLMVLLCLVVYSISVFMNARAIQKLEAIDGSIRYSTEPGILLVLIPRMWCSRISETVGYQRLIPFQIVTEINCSSTKITDDDLDLLCEFKDLEALNLGETEISDVGLIKLKGLSNLKELRLADTKVSDAGLVHLRGLTNFIELNLSGTEVSNAGLIH